MSEKMTIIVPKKAIEAGAGKKSRNSIVDVLVRAGYDNVLNGLNGLDRFEQGDYVFQGVKGPEALALQMERIHGPVGMIMGADTLAEADLDVRNYGFNSRIQRILDMEIGRCRLDFLAPEERPISNFMDLHGRMMFTKYPELLKRILRSLHITDSTIRQTDGADTRVNEWRNDVPHSAAFEIVETGNTARKNGLQIVGDDNPIPMNAGVPYLDASQITTGVYGANLPKELIYGAWFVGALRRLGLDLESALSANQHRSIKWNCLKKDQAKYAGMGLRGPTVSPIATDDGREWVELEIFVPASEVSVIREQLVHKGASEIGIGPNKNVELSAADSEVMQALPFMEAHQFTTPAVDSVSPEESLGTACDKVFSLRDKIADRAVNPAGTTSVALEKGVDFCVFRYQSELVELVEALGRESKEDIAAEASQCVYWLMVLLQAKGIAFTDVLEFLANDPYKPVELTGGTVASGNLVEETSNPPTPDERGLLTTVVTAAERSNGHVVNHTIDGYFRAGLKIAKVRLIEHSTGLATNMRLDEPLEATYANTCLRSAAESLAAILAVLRLSNVDFRAVTDEL